MVNELRERVGGWMHIDLRGKLKRMGRWIQMRKLAILVVLIWGLSVGSIAIKSYLLPYIKEPKLFETGMVTTIVSQWRPRLDVVDFLLIFAIGLISGAILADLQKVLYGWMASTFLSFFIPVIFASFFIWFLLGAGEIFSSMLGWEAIELVSYVAFRIIFKMMFPLVPIFSLLAVFVGTFLRSIIQPSAGT